MLAGVVSDRGWWPTTVFRQIFSETVGFRLLVLFDLSPWSDGWSERTVPCFAVLFLLLAVEATWVLVVLLRSFSRSG